MNEKNVVWDIIGAHGKREQEYLCIGQYCMSLFLPDLDRQLLRSRVPNKLPSFCWFGNASIMVKTNFVWQFNINFKKYVYRGRCALQCTGVNVNMICWKSEEKCEHDRESEEPQGAAFFIQVDLLQHLVRSDAPTEGEESDYCEPLDQI